MTYQRPTLAEFNVPAAIWQSKVLIAAITIFASGVGLFAVTLKTPVYQAETSLIFRFDREYMPRDLSDDSWHGEPIRLDLDMAVQTDLEILGSRWMIEQTLAQVGPRPTDKPELSAAPVPIDKQIDEIRRVLSIRRVEGTTVVRLTFDDPDPDYARAFLETLLAKHLAERQTLLEWARPEAVQQVVDRAAMQNDAAAEKLAAFRQSFGGQDLDAARYALQTLRAELAAPAPVDTAAPIPNTEEIAKIDENLGILTLQIKRLNELQFDADEAKAQYRKIREIAAKRSLSSQLSAARGPAVIVLDPPSAQSDPIGLSAVANGILSGGLGFALACLLAFWLAWSKNGSLTTSGDRASSANKPSNQPSVFAKKPLTQSAPKSRPRTKNTTQGT